MTATITAIIEQINQQLLGKEHQIKQALGCIFANGHLLLEDVPGVGKTTLAHALAISCGLSYQRVQFTSDMLPADLIGVSIFDTSQQQFTFHQGPVFNQVLLADEINRTSPKTQSALLEAMAERQVSVDGKTYPLPDPFFVIATQNPLEHSGTFELPDSQLDRFSMCISLGYPSVEAEKKILQGKQIRGEQLQAIMDKQSLQQFQTRAAAVSVSEPVLDYLLALVQETRVNSLYPHALSPRASQAILAVAKAWAMIEGRDYLLPEDIQAILPGATEHRLRGTNQRTGQSYSEQLLHSINPIG
ncbi:MoxR family ATPase [Psychrobium sp. 1_MG-2023]|uniref:AAA family ATPase n=1 Tax=Psychrobium sp. 1_MG-2023 TaxID=3062624 RepID=UPI000C33B82B|nr:MoxR family ATPase [Psychrobium sp. 1_MG-2023]MDP2561093.1 MoxR family ATPase [Psychrobium sp. 1_MG-2023]PKF58398.1 AAA family ATPase [Alteromonadales bacterium alter-6D02]